MNNFCLKSFTKMLIVAKMLLRMNWIWLKESEFEKNVCIRISRILVRSKSRSRFYFNFYKTADSFL